MIEGVEVRAAAVVRGGQPILGPVNFALGPGQSGLITGPNGSGKTTLLSLVAGRDRPSTGSVRVAGRPANERDPKFRASVAAMLGEPPMARDLTIAENLAMVEASWGSAGALGGAASVSVALGLDRLSRRFPHEISSGERQIFGLAMVLLRPAELVILDEPERRLDGQRLEAVIGALSALAAAGVAVIAATHSARLAASLGGKALRLPGPA